MFPSQKRTEPIIRVHASTHPHTHARTHARTLAHSHACVHTRTLGGQAFALFFPPRSHACRHAWHAGFTGPRVYHDESRHDCSTSPQILVLDCCGQKIAKKKYACRHDVCMQTRNRIELVLPSYKMTDPNPIPSTAFHPCSAGCFVMPARRLAGWTLCSSSSSSRSPHRPHVGPHRSRTSRCLHRTRTSRCPHRTRTVGMGLITLVSALSQSR